MKRRDLKPGMVVDIVSGYRRIAGAIVLDTESWTYGANPEWGGRYRPAYKPYDDKTEIPIAVPDPAGNVWYPGLTKLNLVQPPGSVTRLEAKERAEREAENRAYHQRHELGRRLASRLGVDYLFVQSDGSVRVSTDLLERVLDERDRLEAEVQVLADERDGWREIADQFTSEQE